MKNLAITLAGLLACTLPTSAACNDYLLIDTRGTGEPQGESIGFKPMIAETLATVPNGARYDTVYPAAGDLTQQTTFIGSHDIEKKINQGLKSCPQQKYALLGYSQGTEPTYALLDARAMTRSNIPIRCNCNQRSSSILHPDQPSRSINPRRCPCGQPLPPAQQTRQCRREMRKQHRRSKWCPAPHSELHDPGFMVCDWQSPGHLLHR